MIQTPNRVLQTTNKKIQTTVEDCIKKRRAIPRRRVYTQRLGSGVIRRGGRGRAPAAAIATSVVSAIAATTALIADPLERMLGCVLTHRGQGGRWTEVQNGALGILEARSAILQNGASDQPFYRMVSAIV